MDYKIIYERLFVKVSISLEDCYLPLVLAGDGNHKEYAGRGKLRGARKWSTFCTSESEFFKRYGIPVVLEEDMEDYIPSERLSQESYFKINSKLTDSEGLTRFWNNGMKSAKTLDEINEMRLYPVSIYVKVLNRKRETVFELEAKTSDSLEEALFHAGTRYKIEDDATMEVYFSQEGVLDTISLKEKYKPKKKTKTNILEEQGYAYVFKSEDWYLQKLRKRVLHSCHGHENARMFRTAKEALKWKEKLLERGFSEEKINSFGIVLISEDSLEE